MHSLKNIKPKIIRFLNPVRRKYSEIYSFILAGYLGRIIIVLNQIDHNILEWIFYFFVFSPRGPEIKEFHKVIGTMMMGNKLYLLKEIHRGNTVPLKKEVKSLTIIPEVELLKNNINISQIINILNDLVSDTRNPLVHSNYFLGWGNEYEWNLSYHRAHYNKKKDEIENSPFTIKEAKSYLREVKIAHDRLLKLFVRTLSEIYKDTSN